MMEGIMQFLLFLLVGGIKYPRFAAGAGILGIVGRFLYVIGYATAPKYRMGGFILSQTSLSFLLISSVLTVKNVLDEAGWPKISLY